MNCLVADYHCMSCDSFIRAIDSGSENPEIPENIMHAECSSSIAPSSEAYTTQVETGFAEFYQSATERHFILTYSQVT